MEIAKELLSNLDPYLMPVYIELYDEYAMVIYNDGTLLKKEFEKVESGGLKIECVFKPLYFRRN